MNRWTRFIEWCQRPSKIKIRTYNPRNVVVLVAFSIIIASSITFGTWRYTVPQNVSEYTFIPPEDIETLTITTDTTLTEDYTGQIVIAADGVTLDGDGHMIIGPGSDVDYIGDPNMDTNTDPYWMEDLNVTVGILLDGRTGVTVKNCHVTGFATGFFLNGSSGNTLQGNTANNNGGSGFMLEGSFGNTLQGNTANNNSMGFYLFESDWNSFEANTANDNEIGFFLIETYWNSFEANTANENFHFGFFLVDTFNATLRDNTANGNNKGFGFQWSVRNTLQGNTANDNVNGFELMGGCDWNSFEANTANNNTHAGFHVGGSSNNTFTGDIASNNEYGICFGPTGVGSPNNSIYHNNFVNNIKQVNIKNMVNAWDDGSSGNYWSDYTGVDTNGDGIGDTPYVINKNNVDRFPLMTPMSVFDDGT